MLRWLKKSKKKRRSRNAPRRGDGPKLSSGSSGGPRISSKSSGSNAHFARFGHTPRRKPKPFPRRVIIRVLFKTGLVVGALFAAYVLILALRLPEIDTLTAPKTQFGIKIESEDGTVIATYGQVYGEMIPFPAIPKALVYAVISIEDRRFFEHGGIDYFGILRAMLVNIWRGRVVQGGSTITQQLAKNLFLTPERTLSRKVQEALLAFKLEARYSKQEILAIYLNHVYLGSGTYGIDAASRRYFNKGARELNLMESAMLAGLLKAPSRYAPTSSATRAQLRATQVLYAMRDAGYMTDRQALQSVQALNKALPSHVVEGSSSRYFGDWIVDQLPRFIGKVESDLVVTTTLSPKMQVAGEEALTNVMATEGPAKNVRQAALLSMAPDGAVRAMIGGINYGTSQFNRATQAKRHAGSTFKVFVYLAALEAGYSPRSVVLDAPITLRVGNRNWSPRNYTPGYKGDVTFAQAVRESLNTPAVRVSQAVGIYRVASMAKRMGIADVPNNPSIALGAVETTLLELTGAFAHLANNGNSVKPYGILEVKTADGKTLYQRRNVGGYRTLGPGIVQMMNYMLTGVVSGGTGTRARIPGRSVAGKTGTSQDFKDAWFVGYTPQLVTGVWVGNDDNNPMKAVTGGNTPAILWRSFMTEALKRKPAAPLPVQDEAESQGLFPWFEEEKRIGDAPESTGEIPTNAPFGRANPSSESKKEDILDKRFWNELFDGKVPEGKVEYEYPEDKRRR
jgi:penicillin-binding protein 1A